MLNCREATQRASALLDNSLSTRERLGLTLHLMVCRNCRRYLRQLQLTVASLKGLIRLQTDPADAAARATRLARELRNLPGG